MLSQASGRRRHGGAVNPSSPNALVLPDGLHPQAETPALRVGHPRGTGSVGLSDGVREAGTVSPR